MIEFYPQIKLVHVAAALISGSLFALRAALLLLGQQWVMSSPVRYLSYSMDTVLLTAALMLMTVLHQFPGATAWLTVKVALVLLYIVLGIFALKRGRTRSQRLTCAVAALLVFGLIVSIARTHSPLGLFLWLQR